MRLIVNGEDLEILHVETIQELLDELRVEPCRVAVEVNLAVIKRADYAAYRLNDGDKVEIVSFVGGG